MRVAFHLLDAGIGGGQKVASQVAEELVSRGHELGLLVPGRGPTSEAFSRLGAEVRGLDLGTLRRPAGVAVAARALRRYDLLYSHTSVPGQILGHAAAALARRPHVIHQHTFPYFSPAEGVGMAQRALYRALLPRTTFIAVAEHVAAGLRLMGVDRCGIRVVPNGVEVADGPSGGPVLGGPVRIGMLARFDPGKGMHTLVAAAREARLGPGSTITIFGWRGPFAGYEEEVRARAGTSGVSVRHGVDGESFLRAVDVVVVPSAYEGCPLVLLEAMAASKTVVASDVSGIREIVGPGEAGVLFPPGDEAALGRALTWLAGDREAMLVLGKRARETVAEGFTLRRALDSTVEILERAGGARTGREGSLHA